MLKSNCEHKPISDMWHQDTRRDSSCSIVARLLMDDQGSFLGSSRVVYSPQRLGALSAYPMGPGALSSAIKTPGLKANHSPPSSAEVGNAWRYTSTVHTSTWRDA